MTDRIARIILSGAAAGGAAIAAYLTILHFRDVAPVCFTSGCETVQRSSYAELFGVPVAALGLGAYALLFGSALARRATLLAAAAAVGPGAAAFSSYLVYVQLAVLDALCIWCIASDALLAVAVGMAVVRFWCAVE